MNELREKLRAAFRTEHREHIEAVRGMLLQNAPGTIDFNEAHRRLHSLKGAARIVGLEAVEALSERLETVMALAREGKLSFDRRVCDGVQRALGAIEECAAEGQETGPSREAEQAVQELDQLLGGDSAAPARAPVLRLVPVAAFGARRVSVDSADLVLTHARESLAEPLLQDEMASRLCAVRVSLEALQRDMPGLALGTALDELREIGRLHSESAWRAKRQTVRIYRDLSAMRVLPAESVFGGVAGVLRDLARAEGKEVDADVDGLALTADRVILQTLKDPVMQLLRNAVTHGIEPPEARRASGKPPAGQIRFRIAAERNQLILRIEDDGAGLDRARILDEARRRGVLGKTAALPDSAAGVTALLLRPGFSTARQVTELSGRGMGLSLVDKAIGALQGRFALAPLEPYGTAAIITVPSSMASSQFPLVRSGRLFAIPFRCIERVESVPRRDIVWSEGCPAYAGRGRKEMIALTRLADLIGETEIEARDGDLQVVLITSERGRFGLIVDSLAGLQDALVDELDGALPGVDWIAGGLVLADSSVCPVVNPAALEARLHATEPSRPGVGEPRLKKR